MLLSLLRKLTLLRFFNLTSRQVVHGRRWKVPLLGGLGVDLQYQKEPWMLTLLEGLLKHRQNGAFVDVGVNLGQTLMKVKSIEPNRNYIGFEPNAECVHYAMRLCAKNALEGVTLAPFALSSANEVRQLHFYHADLADSSASMVGEYRQQQATRKATIACMKGDEAINALVNDAIAVLKVDVEGAELEVFTGLATRLERDRPPVVFEVLPAYGETQGIRAERQQNVAHFFTSRAYRIYRIVKAHQQFEAVVRVSDFRDNQRLDQCDYLALPDEYGDAVVAQLMR
jgi:FkbM family methyltransferase